MLIPCISLFLALFSLVVVIGDLRRNPQSMRVMNVVWPLTVLWSSLFGLLAYYAFGRQVRREPMEGNKMTMPSHKKWQGVVLSTLHCGAGCTLADAVGTPIVYFFPIVLFGSELIGGWALDYVLALCLGIGFQYWAMRGMGAKGGMPLAIKALKIDFFSLTAWQFGMYSFLLVLDFPLSYTTPDAIFSAKFWFSMQLAMVVGFFFSLPVNYLLIKSGIKSSM